MLEIPPPISGTSHASFGTGSRTGPMLSVKIPFNYLWFNFSGGPVDKRVLLARQWFYWSRATGPLLVSSAEWVYSGRRN